MEAAVKAAAMQAALDKQMADGSKGAAMRMLKQIMVRMVKGEVAMRLVIWQQQVKMEEQAKHAAMQAALEAQMRTQGQGAGLRMLRQIVMRMVKGKVAMRLEI